MKPLKIVVETLADIHKIKQLESDKEYHIDIYLHRVRDLFMGMKFKKLHLNLVNAFDVNDMIQNCEIGDLTLTGTRLIRVKDFVRESSIKNICFNCDVIGEVILSGDYENILLNISEDEQKVKFGYMPNLKTLIRRQPLLPDHIKSISSETFEEEYPELFLD